MFRKTRLAINTKCIVIAGQFYARDIKASIFFNQTFFTSCLQSHAINGLDKVAMHENTEITLEWYGVVRILWILQGVGLAKCLLILKIRNSDVC